MLFHQCGFLFIHLPVGFFFFVWFFLFLGHGWWVGILGT